jgi:hypothetical protein
VRIPGGYILAPRNIFDGELSHQPPHYRDVYFWLLRNANFKGHTVNGKTIARGQLLCSYDEIAEGLHWYVGYRKQAYKKHHIEKATKWLTKARMVATTKTTRGMIVTILNYDETQDLRNYESDSDSDNKATIKRQDKGKKEKEREHTVGENADQEREISSLAEKLKSIISSQKKVNVTGTKLNGWKKSITMLIRQDGVSLDRIGTVLTWYEGAAGGEFIPVVESGRALREKFIRLEAAMQRQHGGGLQPKSEWDI